MYDGKDDIMEKKVHYFYALRLPSETKARLQEVCNQLRGEFPFKKWVHHEDFHITLAFLGHAKNNQLETSVQYVREALTTQQSFSLIINHLGVFGKKDSPRIFWAGSETSPHLSQVRDLVYDACEESGFQLEKRAFNPHITLARKWTGDTPFSTDFLEKKNPFLNEPEFFNATEVVLYQTHLDRVPKYEVIETFLLK